MSGNAVRQKKEQLYGFDVMRLVAALLVVGLHLPVFSKELGFFQGAILGRVGVPFFFICAGFFWAGPDNKKTGRYLLRLLTLYFAWGLVFFPFILKQQLAQGGSVAQVLWHYVKTLPYGSFYSTFWYVIALITGILLAWGGLKFVNIKVLLVITCIIYVLGALGSGYYGMLPEGSALRHAYEWYFSRFTTTRNGLFFAFPYIVWGYFVKTSGKKIGSNTAAAGLMVSFILYNAECWWLRQNELIRNNDIKLMMLPVSVFLVLFLQNIQVKYRPIYAHMRKASMILYGGHSLLMYAFLPVLDRISPAWYNGYTRYVIVVTICLAGYVVLALLVKVKWLAWLKYLF